MMRAHRVHAGYGAFWVHRVSGLALALFLPLHFFVLGTALEGATALDAALAWTGNPLVKFGEWGLVVLLSLHLAGGIRLLAIEFLPWSSRQTLWLGLGAGVSLAFGLAFALSLVMA